MLIYLMMLSVAEGIIFCIHHQIQAVRKRFFWFWLFTTQSYFQLHVQNIYQLNWHLICGIEKSHKNLSHDSLCLDQGRGVHVTGVSAAYTFKLNKNILSE
jgi:hypothetical protein